MIFNLFFEKGSVSGTMQVNIQSNKQRTPRRRCPKHQARRDASGIQRRLQPPRCATTAWEGRRKSRSAAARQPYHFFTLPALLRYGMLTCATPLALRFGPTFGCSISRLPQRSVLKILLIMSRLSGFLKFAGEGFDVRASDRRAEQAGELGGITDELDLFAKPFRHCPETDL